MTTENNSFKKLSVYAHLGQVFMDKRERLLKVMDTVSDEEFDQICNLAQEIEGTNGVISMKMLREMWKRERGLNINKNKEPPKPYGGTGANDNI